MTLSKKAIRQIVGYTFLKVETYPENWFERARQFNSVTNLIYQNHQNHLSPVYYYNAESVRCGFACDRYKVIRGGGGHPGSLSGPS